MAIGLLIVELGIDATNAQIVDKMRVMKQARSESSCKHVVCVVSGFNSDSRELQDIPEVRAFCLRLVNLGFISYLDFTTYLYPSVPASLRSTWGAAEVWLCGENRLNAKTQVTTDLITEIKAVCLEANRKADATLGELK